MQPELSDGACECGRLGTGTWSVSLTSALSRDETQSTKRACGVLFNANAMHKVTGYPANLNSLCADTFIGRFRVRPLGGGFGPFLNEPWQLLQTDAVLLVVA